MNPRNLIRDPKRVHDALRQLDDGRLVTTTGCKIYIPVRFEERELASIGIETYIIGIYAMVVEDQYYAVSLVNAMARIDPTSTLRTMIDGDEYYEFVFDPGSTVFPSVDLVKTDTIVYLIYNEIFAKGRVPWYLGYDELAMIFDTARYHAGANIGQNQEVTELLVSIIARNPNNRHEYYRQFAKTAEAMKTPPAFIALRSVSYSATNTLNKLAGSYARDGLVSALVNPTDRVERIEELLRR